MLNLLATDFRKFLIRLAFEIDLTLAVVQIGISITIWVEPAAIFLDKMEAIICPSLSKSSALSMRINKSSAGLNTTDPPHTTQPFSCSTTFFIWGMSKSTDVNTSMVSAVPACDVIALEDVFGI